MISAKTKWNVLVTTSKINDMFITVKECRHNAIYIIACYTICLLNVYGQEFQNAQPFFSTVDVAWFLAIADPN